ncbi:MAG: BlaI/MecI/CopY family transcriptional regulator [Phycisphaerales bacterium]
MARRKIELAAGELDVMKALWDAGPSTVRETMFRLHQAGRRVAYTTVLTVLSRLEKKGFVASDKSDVAYIYRAKVSRDRVIGARVREVVKQLYDGAAAPLVLQLMQSERFSRDEIAEFQRLVEQLDREAKPNGRASEGTTDGSA